MDKITHKIENERRARGWSVYKLSDESGVSTGTIHNWIHTNAQPSIRALEPICRAFGITLAEFFLDGSIIEFTPERKELLDKWGSLTHEKRVIVQSVIDRFANKK